MGTDPAGAGPGPVRRVLVVDDSLTMRTTLSRMLADLGLDVTEAVDGADALALLEHDRFEIVFIDWYMPRLAGLELVRRIRADDRFTDLRLVMVTSECENSNIACALEAGVDEYVTKPFDRSVFEAKLSAIGMLPGAAG